MCGVCVGVMVSSSPNGGLNDTEIQCPTLKHLLQASNSRPAGDFSPSWRSVESSSSTLPKSCTWLGSRGPARPTEVFETQNNDTYVRIYVRTYVCEYVRTYVLRTYE